MRTFFVEFRLRNLYFAARRCFKALIKQRGLHVVCGQRCRQDRRTMISVRRQISNFELRGPDGFIRTGPNIGPEIAGFLSLATPHRRAFSQVIQRQHMSAQECQRCNQYMAHQCMGRMPLKRGGGRSVEKGRNKHARGLGSISIAPC